MWNVVIVDYSERLDAGGEVPAGECPKCGALCYVVEEDNIYHKAGLTREDLEKQQNLIQDYLSSVLGDPKLIRRVRKYIARWFSVLKGKLLG